jgi:hypothetical protein
MNPRSRTNHQLLAINRLLGVSIALASTDAAKKPPAGKNPHYDPLVGANTR